MRSFATALTRVVAVTGTVICAAVEAIAQQQAPDAGRLLQEVRPAPTLPRRPPADIRIEDPPAARPTGGPRIHIARVTITGATAIPERELHALLAGAEGKELSLEDLRALADRITEHYRRKGYLLTRAYVPAQEVTSGLVQIAVIEGRLGEVTVDNHAGLGGAALSPLEQLRTGAVAEAAHLERNLLLVSDLPGIEVRSTLKPGTAKGASDLLVQVSPGARFAGGVDFDDYGDRFSGGERLGATLNFNNPLLRGDQATLRGVVSNERMGYLRGSYQLPVSGHGTRVGVAASAMHYRLGSELAPLDAKGSASVESVYAVDPVVRSRNFNLNAQLQFDRVALHDTISTSGTDVHRTLNNWTAAVSADWQDGLGSLNTVSAAYTSGDLHLDAVTSTLDAATARTAGSFRHSNVGWHRVQPLVDHLSLYLSAIAQFASKNLDSSQKMSLGGIYGVRAYPLNEAPGDEGYLVTLEARRDLSTVVAGAWQLTAFLDTGHVRQNKRPWAVGPNKRTLSGFGVGLNAALSDRWYLKIAVARRIGSALPTSDSDRPARLWVQGGRSF